MGRKNRKQKERKRSKNVHSQESFRVMTFGNGKNKLLDKDYDICLYRNSDPDALKTFIEEKGL